MEQEKETAQNKIVETYAEDMARVISDDQGGLIKKIIQGEEMKEQEKNQLSPESRQNKLYVIFGSIFLVLSLALISYFVFKNRDNTVPVEEQFAPLIFNDKSFFIEIGDLNKEKIVDSILAESRTTNVKSGGVEGIYLTNKKQIVGLREFVTLMKANWLVPADVFVSDNFMVGLYNGTAKDLFVLVKMRSFIDIFESLRTWEDKMFLDLRTLFGININAENNYLFTKNFDDGIVENKNARILHDKEGKIVLMYVFANENSLIIASSTEAVKEAILRLSGGEQKK